MNNFSELRQNQKLYAYQGYTIFDNRYILQDEVVKMKISSPHLGRCKVSGNIYQRRGSDGNILLISITGNVFVLR